MAGAPRQEDRYTPGNRASVFYSAAVRVGRYVVCAQMVRLGKVVSADDDGITLTMSRPQVLAAMAFDETIEPPELKRIFEVDLRSQGDVMESPYDGIEDAVLLDGPCSFVPAQARNSASDDP